MSEKALPLEMELGGLNACPDCRGTTLDPESVPHDPSRCETCEATGSIRHECSFCGCETALVIHQWTEDDDNDRRVKLCFTCGRAEIEYRSV